MSDFRELLSDDVVQAYLAEVVGAEGMPVAMNPVEDEIVDEDLAEKLDLDPKIVRRTLFILYENDLASYRRDRDEESGWYTYLWSFEYDNIPEKLNKEMKKLRDTLDERIEYEIQNEFYICDIDGIRFEFEEAMDLSFNCPECGSPLEPMENDELVEAMVVRHEELEEELEKI
ncbi:MAG: transcription factor [Halobacteriales archaeon]|nr:transcription factor [Halobacteriales archaeon]